jgi:hypothetical protein
MTKTSMFFFRSLLTISTNKSSHKIHKSTKLRMKPQETKKPQIFKKINFWKKTKSCWIWNVFSIHIVHVLYMYCTQFQVIAEFYKIKILICWKFKTNKKFWPKLILQNKIIIWQAPIEPKMVQWYYKSMFFSPRALSPSNQVHFFLYYV